MLPVAKLDNDVESNVPPHAYIHTYIYRHVMMTRLAVCIVKASLIIKAHMIGAEGHHQQVD